MKSILLPAFAGLALATLPSFSSMPAVILDAHDEQEVSFQYINPCTGLLLDITGSEASDFHVVDNGKRVNVSSHNSGQYRATDEFGRTYVGHFNDNERSSGPSDAGSGLYTGNLSFKVHFVGQGGVQGFDLIEHGHYTVTPKGDVVVDRYTQEVQCK